MDSTASFHTVIDAVPGALRIIIMVNRSYFGRRLLQEHADVLEQVLKEIQFAEVVGLDALVLEAAPKNSVSLFFNAFLIQEKATGEKCDLEKRTGADQINIFWRKI